MVHSKHEHAFKCCALFSLICFVSLLIGGFILCFHTLVPSINKAAAYKESSCFVQQSYVDIVCGDQNSACSSYNDQIFWYNSYGSSYFFVYVSGGSAPSDYSDDDNDDDGNGGGSNESENDDDTGDSGGGDSGGGDSGGGFGDDGDYVADIINTQSTSGGSIGVMEVKEISKQRKLQSTKSDKVAENSGKKSDLLRKLQQIESSSNGTAAAGGSSSSGSQCDGSYYDCFQGDQLVYYFDENNIRYNATVFGLWSSDQSWVNDYVGNYLANSSYDCWYNTDNNGYVMWFQPPAYDKSAMTGTIILFVLAFIFLVITIVLAVKIRSHHNKTHHGSNHHNGYTVIQSQTTYQAQQPPQKPFYQPQPNYYQYNQGVPSMNPSAPTNF